ncbi:Uncharacterised protein [Streptococcus pneumoniae]|nr:Uncharacterised protein [Streptococcus pneumoniae]
MSDEVFLFEEIEEIVAPTDGEFLGEVLLWYFPIGSYFAMFYYVYL